MRRVPLVAMSAAVAAATVFASVAIAADARTPAAAQQVDPVVFLKAVIRQLVRNDYGRAWLTLNPAQQEAVPQDQYVECELLSPISGRLDWIRAVRVSSRPMVVPGGSAEPVLTTAVTFRLKLAQPLLRSSVVITHTAHAVAADGRWSWILPASRFEFHRSGACLAGSVPG